MWIHVVAGSFEGALKTVRDANPGVQIKGIDLLNYVEGQAVLTEGAKVG